ncbi:MAG: hypothetical protein ACOZQL_06020 [Myxococcota bacterium]
MSTPRGLPSPLFVLFPLLVACGGGGGGEDGTTFVGTFTTTSITTTEAREGTVRFDGEPVEALVERAGGGWDRVPGEARAEGGFRITGLPASGPIVVHFVNEYFYTSARTLDFSVASLGRGGLRQASSPTPITFSGTGMSAWSEGDELELIAFDSGVVGDALQKLAASAPTPGSAQLSLTWDHAKLTSSFLVQGEVQVAHLATFLTGESVPYRAIESVARVSGVTMADGLPLALDGTFVPVSGATTRLDATWSRSAFDRFQSLAHPKADQGVAALEVFALPRAAQFGPYRRGAKLAAAMPGEGVTDTPVSFEFTNPWEGTDLYAEASVVYARGYGLDGKERTDIKCGVSVTDELAAFTGELTPRIGPPRTLTLDGADARDDLSGLGETPRLEWQPPSFGTADQYVVAVWRLGTNATQTTKTRIAMLYTQDTAVRLPPGLLTAGDRFFVQVIALSSPRSSLATKPYARSFPVSYGAAVSGVLSR